jgi:4'-phosphopantetheinyl transferase EntD
VTPGEPPGLRTGPATLLAGLLPAPVAVAETFGDQPGAGLLGAEQAAVARAVPKRRREFTTGRACARAALAGLGLPPVPVPTGPHGAPGWPAGVVGSITHCAGYRAAAVARRADLASLGVDAEPDEPLPDGVLNQVSRPEERVWLAGPEAAAPGGPCWDRLLFCAKEAVYKAWFPLTGQWLGFGDAAIQLAADGTFRARLLVPGPVLPGPVPGGQRLAGFTGRWRSSHGLLLTAIAVPTLAGS